MYHAMPARCGPASGLIAVSRAPQTLPFAYQTCCMRVSFESGREMTSGPRACAAAVTRPRQHPGNALNTVTVVSSFRQKPCGTAVVGAVPDPGCCCLGGIAYVPT